MFVLSFNVAPNFQFNFFFFYLIKQFVITNCSKERPGSIVTKTLKNGISIPIATSKESHFNSDFKYVSFIKFSLTQARTQEFFRGGGQNLRNSRYKEAHFLFSS